MSNQKKTESEYNTDAIVGLTLITAFTVTVGVVAYRLGLKSGQVRSDAVYAKLILKAVCQ